MNKSNIKKSNKISKDILMNAVNDMNKELKKVLEDIKKLEDTNNSDIKQK